MVCSLLLLLALSLHRPGAIRTTVSGEDPSALTGTPENEQESGCRPAEATENPWRFTLDYSRSRGVQHHEAYALRPSSDCTGKDLANVAVIPKIHPLEPLNKSTVVIAVEPKDLRGEAYVCHQAKPATCLATVMPPRLRFRPHQLLMGLPGFRKSRWLMDLHLGEPHPSIDILEWGMLAISICFIGTTCHAIYVLCGVMSRADISGAVQRMTTLARAEEPVKEGPANPCPIYISTPFWESLDAWMNSTSFVVACVSLLRVLLSIQVYTNGPAILLGVTVLWPATCGNVLLYCFWMSTCRLQLYTAALSCGICIRGTNPTSTSLVFMGSCIGLLALCALATALCLLMVNWDMGGSMNKARELSPFVLNPMASLSSILVFVYLRSLAQHKTQCPMAIDEMVQLLQSQRRQQEEEEDNDAKLQGRHGHGSRLAQRLSTAEVPVVSESSFCELCRRRLDPVEFIEAETPLPQGPSFGVLDLRWQGKVVHRLSGYSVAILNTPIALFFFLVLTASSVFLAILGLTTKPSISRFEASQNSLGVLSPPLRNWQTDYELVLHSSAHSFTFAVATKQSSSLKVRMADEKNYTPQGDSFMATVELDGVPIPKTVELDAGGILGRLTKYELSVVRDMELVQCMQIVPRNERVVFPARLIQWGHVERSVFSLPETANRVEITFFHTKFSLGIPTSIEEAEEQPMSVLTVYEPVANADTRSCKSRCSALARCLTSDIGKLGCFYVWGPSVFGEGIFQGEVQPGRSHPHDRGRLGARMCRLNGQCKTMDRDNNNLLHTTVHFRHPFNTLHRRTIRLFEKVDGREALKDDEPVLSFARSVVAPAAVLCYIDGVQTTVKVEVERSQFDVIGIDIMLDGYVLDGNTYPFKHGSSNLTMYLAILLPDPAMHVLGHDARWSIAPGSVGTDMWHNDKLERNDCETANANQFSVCGGWRPSKVWSRTLDLWEPEGLARLEIGTDETYGMEMRRTPIRVRTIFQEEGSITPAGFTIAKSCKLDFRGVDTHQQRSILTLEVYEQMILHCDQVDIHESDNFMQRQTSVDFTKEAMAKFHQQHNLIHIIEAIETSDRIHNKSHFFHQVGFNVDNGELSVKLAGRGSWMKAGAINLLLPDLVKGLNTKKRGGKHRYTFVAWACHKLPEKTLAEVAQSTFLAVARNYERSLAVAMGQCFSAKISYMRLSPNEINPVLLAIKFQHIRLLRHILMISSCCFTLEKMTTYTEYAVAHGCFKCLKVLLMPARCEKQVLGDGYRPNIELHFSRSTTPDMWGRSPEVAEAFKFLSPNLRTLSFSFVPLETPLRAILYELFPLARRGYLQKLEYLSFTRYPPAIELDDELVENFCELAAANSLKNLKVLFMGLEATSIQTLGSFLRCLSMLPTLVVIDMMVSKKVARHLTTRMFNKIERLQVLYTSRGFVTKAHTGQNRKNLTFRVLKADRAKMLKTYFERRRCRPSEGTELEYSSKVP